MCRRRAPVAYSILKEVHIYQNKHVALRLQWVSHIGLSGNEEADKLAKLDIQNALEVIIFPNYIDTKEYFNERSREMVWYT